MQNLFLSYKASRPSERWQKAFPDGRGLVYADLVAAAHGADTVIWVSTASSNWETMLKLLRKDVPAARIVVVSQMPDSTEGLRVLDNGGRGYCHALSTPNLFAEVASAVFHGGLWLGPDLVGRIVSAVGKIWPEAKTAAPGMEKLSQRELEVAEAVAKGLSNKEVALKLNITERTVKAHLSTTFEKLGVRDRVQLALHLSGQ